MLPRRPSHRQNDERRVIYGQGSLAGVKAPI